ncbi:hypothetical protein TTHERM_001328979 (macronuclear) [Tetrahymena thermophila SB210]|uniref:Uncharacterized protein n=1 Tax=Tetrahymena thermophila (strain SB210) TaxID=312017 RepID=W7XDD4_TETTS|nr:hypothetical protein TTHERM_001328979 [Tetrahymena thermophila SB210]EWS74653.1 hypothetical protein TTHERM_001328979 [Tetrahymena thermophila SB210]|eukprot:XP_012652814.1 hypothetical protein TTHERM_001328979 [Tetrahymena thermophila SB210]
MEFLKIKGQYRIRTTLTLLRPSYLSTRVAINQINTKSFIVLNQFYKQKYHNPKQINYFYQILSAKFERLIHFDKARTQV